MTLAYLKRYKLVYLASPYTKSPNLDTACREVCLAAAELMKAGVYPISPIAHSHTVAMLSGLNPKDHAFWLDQCRPLQAACDAIVILKLPGWDESDGIKAEWAQAYLLKQPVYYLDPVTLFVSCND